MEKNTMDKIINISLNEFIQNGNFGKIKIGHNVNDVIKYLGENFDKGLFKKVTFYDMDHLNFSFGMIIINYTEYKMIV
jgi:hypothetical protein